nr:tRNA lysidine(34) synthetase TilS [Vibrio splendidus]MCC4880422.1 tRNA lysidine(34) synthetase TilS [Vibrio splendidus]
MKLNNTQRIENSVKVMLQELGVRKVIIGLSGGVDSVVLAHALSVIADENMQVTCLHVNHGISDSSLQWQQHCESVAASFGFDFFAKQVNLKGARNLESVARDVRYDFFAEHVCSESVLLTAHHLNDQAETFLLRLMRGSGVDGLCAMMPTRVFGDGTMIRPLLDFTKDELIQYAKDSDLTWVEDESNSDSKYDRNFIRNEVMPLLESRWGGAPRSIAKAASHMQSASSQLKDKAASLVKWNVHHNRMHLSERYKALDSESKALLLREWMAQNSLKAMNQSRLHHFIAKVDEIRDMNNQLYVDVDKGIRIAHYNGMLHIVHEQESLTVEFNEQVGDTSSFGINVPVAELVRIPYKGNDMVYFDKCHRQLRRFLKDRKVPVWEREKYPIYTHNGKIILVGEWVSDPNLSFFGSVPSLKRDH